MGTTDEKRAGISPNLVAVRLLALVPQALEKRLVGTGIAASSRVYL
jgi:hypothetical protein